MGVTLDAYITAFTRRTGGPTLIQAFFNSMWIYSGRFGRLFRFVICGLRVREIEFQSKESRVRYTYKRFNASELSRTDSVVPAVR